MDKGPCYKCTLRVENCHSTCELYKKWRHYLDELREKERRGREKYCPIKRKPH